MPIQIESARARAAACFAAGAVMALGQPPFGLWPLTLLGAALIFSLWPREAGRPGFWFGWRVGFGYFVVALHWIVEPFFVDIAAHGWIAPFALVILPGGMALFWGAAFALAAWLSRRRNAGPHQAAAALVLFWSLAEFTRSYIFTGFPWALPVYIWTDTPVAQISAWIGPYGLTLLTLALGGFAGTTLSRASLFRFAPAGASLAIVAALWALGAARAPEADAPADAPVIRVVQTAVDQETKWDLENVESNFAMLLEFSTAPAREEPAVIVWPESAVTFPIDMSENARERIGESLGDASLALGSLRMDGGPAQEITPASRWRNSLFLLGDDGEAQAIFDKIHLVPFGEYFPFDEFVRSLGVIGLGSYGGGIVPGDAPVLMSPENAPPFAPLICYEMIFAKETMAASEGASWMALVTNDGWFGGWAGPAQHLAMAQFRAIETGLPIARSANQGVSAMIDPYGRANRRGGGRSGLRRRRLAAPLPTDALSPVRRLFHNPDAMWPARPINYRR